MNPPELAEKLKETISSVAVTEVPTRAPEMQMPDASIIPWGIGSVGVSLLTALIYLRRKIPSDSLAISKDRIEGELLNKVMLERDAAVKRADDFSAKHSADAALIAGLQERNRYLQEEVTRLNKAMEKLEAQFDELKKSVRSLTTESRKPITSPGNADSPPGGPSTVL